MGKCSVASADSSGPRFSLSRLRERAGGEGKCRRLQHPRTRTLTRPLARPFPRAAWASSCRHYDRRARCFAGLGQVRRAGNARGDARDLSAPVGRSLQDRTLRPGPRKHGLTLSLGRRKSPWQEPRWNADRRAHPCKVRAASRDAEVIKLRLSAFRFLLLQRRREGRQRTNFLEPAGAYRAAGTKLFARHCDMRKIGYRPCADHNASESLPRRSTQRGSRRRRRGCSGAIATRLRCGAPVHSNAAAGRRRAAAIRMPASSARSMPCRMRANGRRDKKSWRRRRRISARPNAPHASACRAIFMRRRRHKPSPTDWR